MKRMTKFVDADSAFKLNFFEKQIVLTNEIAYATLNLFNLTNFWFDLAILDLHVYLAKMRLPFLFL